MSDCKWCGKGGFWMSVDGDGLCGQCRPLVGLEANQRVRIISDCQRIVNTSKNLETILSRCDLAIAQAEAVRRLEDRGIHVVTPNAAEIASSFRNNHDEAILTHVREKMRLVSAESELGTAPKSVVTKANKVLLQIRELKTRMKTPGLLDSLESQVSAFVHMIQTKALLDSAEKAEFMGRPSKAIEKYQELLYFLKTDRVDDSDQTAQIQQIEAKIAALEATAATGSAGSTRRATGSSRTCARSSRKIPPGFGGYDPTIER